MATQLNKIAMALSAITLALPSAGAFAIVTAPVATASIDWSTFSTQVIDVNPLDSVLSVLTWGTYRSEVNADAGVYADDFSSNWTASLSAVDGVASAAADTSSLTAQFSAAPSSLNAVAGSNRNADFIITAKTIAVFSVDASTYIDMNVPMNGGAYAWAQLQADGVGPFGTDSQHSSGDKIAWATGIGSPVTDSGKLYASFINLTDSDMSGSVAGFSQVNTYGVAAVAAVPEAQTWAMLVVGLGLVGLRFRTSGRKGGVRLA